MVRENIAALSDEDLVHRYRNSHETTYVGELYQRYTHLVFGVCMKYLKNETEAEDATMQIFEKLIADLKKHHIVTFKPWLHTIAKNYCLEEFRKSVRDVKSEAKLKFELNNFVENEEVDHLQEAEDREFILLHLKEGMEELKEEQRNCIELFYLKKCSYSEIANVTGLNVKEVKSHIQNGKRNLRNYITAKNEKAEKG